MNGSAEALKTERDGLNFIITHINPTYGQYADEIRRRLTTEGMVLADYNLDASSHDESEDCRINVERLLQMTGTDEMKAHSFSQSLIEIVENLKKHVYNFEPGMLIKVHVRCINAYNLGSVVGDGASAVFENVESAFENAMSHIRLLQDLKEGRLPKTEAMNILRGRRGKGVWDIFLRQDLTRFEYHNGSTYYVIMNIK